MQLGAETRLAGVCTDLRWFVAAAAACPVNRASGRTRTTSSLMCTGTARVRAANTRVGTRPDVYAQLRPRLTARPRFTFCSSPLKISTIGFGATALERRPRQPTRLYARVRSSLRRSHEQNGGSRRSAPPTLSVARPTERPRTHTKSPELRRDMSGQVVLVAPPTLFKLIPIVLFDCYNFLVCCCFVCTNNC